MRPSPKTRPKDRKLRAKEGNAVWRCGVKGGPDPNHTACGMTHGDQRTGLLFSRPPRYQYVDTRCKEATYSLS